VIICPARLEPTFSLRPWGSRSLAPLFPEKSNLAEPIGEAWMTGNESRFIDGPFAGKTLGEAWPAMPPEWTGPRIDHAAAFPLLVKFIFSEEKLSVQVHPDDAYAAKHENGGRGKTEMWYAMNTRPGAEVLAGLKPEVTRESFKRAIANGTAEDCLLHVPVRAGDAVFVPARTAHTIGAGLVLCEIQQQSDTTYRVYDYNRRDANGNARELHVEKALDVIRFGEQIGGKVTPVLTESNGVAKTYFVACPYFATEKWEFAGRAAGLTSRERFELLIILAGNGRITWSGSHAAYAPGQVWLLPAALGEYELAAESSTSVLRTLVPADSKQVWRGLIEQGVTESDLERIVF
jgi:mannose-6-phosphate isomerase